MKRTRTGRILAAVWAAALLLTLLLSGCAGSAAGRADDRDRSENPSGKRLQVVTTIFPPYDFARHIAGDRADVHMLLKPGEEVHSYEPTPQDIRLIQNCDLFIYVGGENDVWVDNIMGSLEEKGPAAVRLLDLVDTFDEEHLEGMMPEKGQHDHGHSETEEGHTAGESEEDHDYNHEEEPDEHVWTSPENCVTLMENLTDAFCELDPSGAEQYRRNGDSYRTAFVELDAQYREMVSAAPGRTILFGDRFPFRYLAGELGLTCYAAFSGCSSESEPSAATIAFLIDKAVEEKLPVVFKIEFSNGNIAHAISEAAQAALKKQDAGQVPLSSQNTEPANGTDSHAPQTGGAEIPQIQVLQLHSCQNLTRDEFEAGETCLSLMKKNLDMLRIALGST